AIIALIISILLPSLSLAREEAKAAKCLANLRSIGTFTIMYRQDDATEHVLWYHFPTEMGVSGVSPWVFGGFKAPRNDANTSGIVWDGPTYPAELRPLNKIAAPAAQGNDIIDMYICPGDRTYSTAIIGQNPTAPDDQQ